MAQTALLDPQAETGNRLTLVPPEVRDASGVTELKPPREGAIDVLPPCVGWGRWSCATPLPSGFNAVQVVVGRDKFLW